MTKLIFLLLFVNCTNQQKVESISVEKLKNLLQKETIQLVDVRTEEEFKQGFIPKAININFFDANFVNQFEKNIDKSQPVYLYCKSGSRSTKAYQLLNKAGFKVVQIEGGYLSWKSKN